MLEGFMVLLLSHDTVVTLAHCTGKRSTEQETMSNMELTTAGDLDGDRSKRGPDAKRRGPNTKPRTTETIRRSILWRHVVATRPNFHIGVPIATWVPELHSPSLIPVVWMVSYYPYFLQNFYCANRRSANSIAAAQDFVTFVAICVYIMVSSRDHIPHACIVDAQRSCCAGSFRRPLSSPASTALCWRPRYSEPACSSRSA